MTNTYIMNCTPHDIHLLSTLFSEPLIIVDPWGEEKLAIEQQLTANLSTFRLPPSGLRLAAKATWRGDAIGCDVSYHLSAEAEDEVNRIRLAFEPYQNQNHRLIVVASELSVRALLTPTGSRLSPIRPMSPIIAEDALRLPVHERWADALAVPHDIVTNEAGEAVGSQPLY